MIHLISFNKLRETVLKNICVASRAYGMNCSTFKIKKFEVTGTGIDKRGVKYYYKNGKIHNNNGHAIEHPNGDKWWYKEGEVHRLNAPACISSGIEVWRVNGDLHREDGPAIKVKKGYYNRYDNWYHGIIEGWYRHGIRHREGGAAVIYKDKRREWWLNGIKYTKEDYYKYLQTMRP